MKSIATFAARAAFSLLVASSAGAEGELLRPTLAPPAATIGAATIGAVTIGSETLAPSRLRAEGERFHFVNEAERTARVVFDRRSRDDVDCASGEGGTGRRAQYLLAPGASLECTAHASKLRYEVFREDGSGRLVKTRGEVRSRAN